MSETTVPRRAAGVTSQFMIDGVPGHLMTAAAASGALTHVDLRVGKHGSTLAGLTNALATAITTGLRGGTPAVVFVDELRHTRYVPAGATNDPDLPHATSLGDYLAQHLHLHDPQWTERP
ncbi:hypothetical protein [Micromonospora sp. LOL_024]|uniref:TSCPD domain-containing protein n=1 Tax=Micromonospora sp. LOL_024 TaxID=3345412 RepID=UPI003A871A55